MKKQTDTFKRLRSVIKDVNGDNRQIIKTMQDQIDYLMEFIDIQGEILEEKTGSRQPELSIEQKKRLAHRGKKLNEFLLGQIENTFAPSTVLKWYSELISNKYNSTDANQKKRGRKPVSADLQELVLRLAEQNPHWGYKRIRDYAEYLGYEVSFMTVKRILNKHGINPSDHDRSNSNWDLFFNTHQDVITACDFATYELVTPYGQQRAYTLF
jgi:hypothetical protein